MGLVKFKKKPFQFLAAFMRKTCDGSAARRGPAARHYRKSEKQTLPHNQPGLAISFRSDSLFGFKVLDVIGPDSLAL